MLDSHLLHQCAWKQIPPLGSSEETTLLLQQIIYDLCLTLILPFYVCNILHDWIFWHWAHKVLSWDFFLRLDS